MLLKTEDAPTPDYTFIHKTMNVPQHVAIVMDGNGRWAQKHGIPRTEGHRAGKESLRRIVEQCLRHGITYLSVFAFSSENWRRPQGEVKTLLQLFESALDKETSELAKNGVRLKMVGDLSNFSPSLQNMISIAEKHTRKNERLHLTVAVGYGGQWDILQAARKTHEILGAGKMAGDEKLFAAEFIKNLSFSLIPDPDLFIRTGGERRISNFMLWQIAYSELYFSDVLWPDFNAQEFDMALAWFAGRKRRFGLTSEQISDNHGNSFDSKNEHGGHGSIAENAETT